MTLGKFITFEGGDGTGKSTQVTRTTDFLKKTGLEVVQTREVGGSPSAEKIREMWLKENEGYWDSLTEVLLITAARREHLVKTILPALSRDAWVVSDRFVDSTRAYQGVGLHLGLDLVDTLNEIIAPDIVPDLTFLLDLPVEVGLWRMQGRGGEDDRYQQKHQAFHQTLRNAYLDLAHADPERIKVIDASGTSEEVSKQIEAVLCERFSL